MGREGRGGQQPVPRYMVPFMLVQRGGGIKKTDMIFMSEEYNGADLFILQGIPAYKGRCY